MYSKTRFGALLEGLPRGTFDRLVKAIQADKYLKGFSCWDHLLAMIFAQVSGVKSLRELESAFQWPGRTSLPSRAHARLNARPYPMRTPIGIVSCLLGFVVT